MYLLAGSENGISLTLLEGGLTTIVFAGAFAWPRLAENWFKRIERAFGRLARKQGMTVVGLGLGTVLLRLAMLPFFPIPLPFVPDDFSNLLASDTFAHGRLTNPTPDMWKHFETIHVDMTPTYMSMYFPAQGLVMAAGRVVVGNAWFGVLLTSGLMCAALCWMLQAWLPPRWALLGGAIAMVRIGLFSYWVNTYTGAGLIAASAGAIVLGALPRLMRTARMRYGLLMAIGMVILALTRPYEGMLLCLPVAFVLGRWALTGKNRPAPAVLLRSAALPMAVLVAGVAWLGYYDYRVFGSPTTLPYTINRATYAMAPYYVWQPRRPEPPYRHAGMRRFYYDSEIKGYVKSAGPGRFIVGTAEKFASSFLFFTGLALLPPLLMFRRVLLDRRIRFLVVCAAVVLAGLFIEVFLLPHYLAPITAALYVIGLQAMRHLRLWRPEGRPVGLGLVRAIVTLCFVMAFVRLVTSPIGFRTAEWPPSQWGNMWYGPEQYGQERANIQAALAHLPGKQLVLVRDSANRYPLDQWVYNDADIDASKVVWAWDMDPANNQELIRYYRDRHVWLVRLDTEPASVSMYSLNQR